MIYYVANMRATLDLGQWLNHFDRIVGMIITLLGADGSIIFNLSNMTCLDLMYVPVMLQEARYISIGLSGFHLLSR